MTTPTARPSELLALALLALCVACQEGGHDPESHACSETWVEQAATLGDISIAGPKSYAKFFTVLVKLGKYNDPVRKTLRAEHPDLEVAARKIMQLHRQCKIAGLTCSNSEEWTQ